MVAGLGAEFHLTETPMSTVCRLSDGLRKQIRLHKMRAGACDEVSAILPQIGAMIADTRNEAENTMPDQRLTDAASTPSSRVRYIGKKGISIV